MKRCNKKIRLSPAVLEFAQDMQFKLDKNKHKKCDTMNPDGKGRGWEDCDLYWLMGRMQDEIRELDDELGITGDWADAMLECADVGNFAMMIHDILNERVRRFEKAKTNIFKPRWYIRFREWAKKLLRRTK